MSMPLISVIVPVYKMEPYLRRCVDSIVNQTYRNLEIILVDDGSPDSCGSMCNEYANKDNRIVVIHKENGGLSSARNAGLAVAKGEYIGFVDSDDWISSDMYETLYKLFEETKCDVAQISAVTTSANDCKAAVKKYKTRVYNQQKHLIKNEEILRKYIHDGLLLVRAEINTVWSKLYKRDLFDSITFPDINMIEDYVTNYKIFRQCLLFCYIDKPCYYYFQSGASITGGKVKKKDFDLITGCEMVYELALKGAGKDIIYLANVKRARCDYSILAKMAVNGCDLPADEQRIIIKQLTGRLRKNYWMLIKAPMPFVRKILMTGLSVNYWMVKAASYVAKKLIG